MPETTPDQYASTIVTLVSLGALALGMLAMLVRAVVRRRHTLRRAGQQLAADVKKGEGFTFHRQPTQKAPTSGTNGRQEAPPQPLTLRQWLDLVNHRPDQVPHLFIEGGSGSGKTTLATAILHDRPGPVAVVGVKPDDQWGEGYIYRSTERDEVLKRLLAEVRRRLDEDDRTSLTIVLDDFTRQARDHTAAVDLYKLIADVGRSMRIRLILIARGRQVKGIGATGESDLLEHFVFIAVARGHRATLEYDEEVYPLDTAQVQRLAQPLQPSRWWRPTERPAAVGQHRKDYLLSLLDETTGIPVSDHHGDRRANPGDTSMPGIRSIPHQDAIPAEDEEGENTEGIPAKLTPEAIRTLYSAWGSKNRVAALLTGKKQKRMAMIDAALAEEETASATR